jgi:CubicO group peptidase (beta-lactamase class C family)
MRTPCLAALLASTALACGGSAGSTASAPQLESSTLSLRCPNPQGAWEQRAASDLGMDGAKLQEALDWTIPHTTASAAVYRHGCLVGQSSIDPLTGNLPLDGWSMTKSVTSMLVGRAVTLGRLDVDEPIGSLVSQADAQHARLTPRELLTMTSGLHGNYVRDFLVPLPDRVCDALALPFDHAPGTTWHYAQTTLDLLIYTVERAVDQDIQTFAQEELFGRVGIPAGSWIWERDPHGHTNAWAHLHMPNGHWARLGQLMLQGGVWNGERLISADYVGQTLSRVADNHAYGFLFWLNGGDSWRVPDVEGPDGGSGSVIPAGPPDMFMMVGLGEQRTFIIPSRDLVIVRLGERGSHETDTRVVVWSGRPGEIDHELVRRVLLAVTDVPYDDPGPYHSAGTVLPPLDQGIVGDAQDVGSIVDGMTTPDCHAS